jgi:hypothetical protein
MEVLVPAASLLIRHGSSDPWDELQELFLQRPEIGTIVAGEMQDDSANTEFLSRMSDSSLGCSMSGFAETLPARMRRHPAAEQSSDPAFIQECLWTEPSLRWSSGGVCLRF